MTEGSMPGANAASGDDPGVGLPSQATDTKRSSDRVLGLICLAIAIWYVAETRNFQITQFGTGPVGPKTLPTLIGIMFGAFALILIIRPEESPRWAAFTVWWRLVIIVGISFLFGQLLEPLGFIAAATIMSVIIGVFFKGPLVKLAPMSFGFAVAIAFVFNNWLELRLPEGLWGGF